MAQIDILKTAEANAAIPGTDRKAYTFDENGNPVMINEDGSYTLLGSGDYIGISEIQIYVPSNSYIIGQFVSYSSANIPYIDAAIYVCTVDAAITESPETNPEKWEYQGLQVPALDSVVYTFGFQEVSKKKFNGIEMGASFMFSQNTDIVSAQNLQIPKFGNLTVLSDSATEIHRIDIYDGLGGVYKGGTPQFIYLKAGQSVRHDASVSGSNKPIWMTAGKNFVASNNILLGFFYDRLREVWLVLGDALADALNEQINFDAVPIQLKGYNVTTSATLKYTTNFFANVDDITNEGSATLVITDNEIQISSGTIYGIKAYDVSAALLWEIPCCENNVLYPYIHDAISGYGFLVTGAKTIIEQDDYKYVQVYGSQNITIYSEIITVPLKTDLTKIYN